MKYSIGLLLAGSLALAACGGGSDDTAMSDDDGPMTAEMSQDLANDMAESMNDGEAMDSGREDDDFTAACLNASNMPEAMCTCMSGKATANLTENGRDFLVATLNENSDRVMALRGQMSLTEMSQAGMFMVNASTECAAEGHNQ
jgi:hypothetical protein|tara:strand:- start:947 stop:1378 length:432 start_codon:yes stop_codon:yes gene_type:complete